ncbi:MAG: zinc metalloprotease HtpX [Phascolarctobacterium sp.]|uniref:zinc metalloprotease HtpX n=1 Tax=Phascolarctobacterium sp. TaxID=2049039 RepID=UPI0026DB207F|nr:zinc metalloprotease HtpX [Phascolarctobacterium sp.]MDO4921206.1 zinc metalloprotease HtpX [Phascolarctobacterium sp.]
MKTTLLMTLMTLLLMLIGDFFGGLRGMTVMLVFGVAMNFFTYWNSDKMVLAHYNAQQVDKRSAPELYGIVEKLAKKAQIPMPKVYIIDSPVPNAFATGRDPEHAAVAVNTALADILTKEELAGVLGHELSHVKHRDILISTVAASMAGAISTIAQWGMFLTGGRDENGESRNPIAAILVMLLAPLAAALIQMAVSRSREYEADKSGGELCGDPNALADALLKIEAFAKRRVMPGATEATAHMFIINPFSGVDMKQLFSTHPATAERVKLLREQARAMGK